MSSLTLLQAALRLANQTEGLQVPGHIAWRAHNEALNKSLKDGKDTLFICPASRNDELTAQFGQADGVTFSSSANGADPAAAAFANIYREGFNAEPEFGRIAQSLYERLQRHGRLVFPAILSDEEAISLRAFTVEGLECSNALTESAIAEKLCEAGFHGITYELAGPSQWFSEYLATSGLVLTILLCDKYHKAKVPQVVAAYVVAAYWFTSSTSFANPAVTIAAGSPIRSRGYGYQTYRHSSLRSFSVG